MQTASIRKIGTSLFLTPVLLLATLPATAQYNQGQSPRQDNRDYQRQDNRNYQRQDNRDNRGHASYYNGMRDGARGGNYDRNDREHYREGYNGYYSNDPGYRRDNGIGPGKGAAIGAAGGAILGGLFGGGMKGVVVGGAAGAGIGAVVGEANQNHRNDRR